MTSDMLQILVLAGIALFLVLRLRSVLGTRDGFEKPTDGSATPVRPDIAPRVKPVVAGPDADIAAHADPASPIGRALAEIKAAEPDFEVGTFVAGARQAYEMIVMGYESGDLDTVRDFLAPDVLAGFEEAIATRRRSGLTVEANFIGVTDSRVVEAAFDPATGTAEITLRLTGELTSAVRNAAGEVVEGDPAKVRQQTDTFTFERRVGSDDPNWILVATGE